MKSTLHMAIWMWLGASCLVPITVVQAADREVLLGPSFSSSADSDGLRVQRRGLTLAHRFEHGWQWQGVEATQTVYSDRGAELKTSALNWVSHHLDPKTGLGEQVKLGISKGPSKNLLSFDASVSRPLGESSGEGASWSLFANQDWVESTAAVRQDTSLMLGGASVEWKPSPRWTQVTLASFTRFSDGASRNQQRLRLIWDTWPDQGVNLQASARFQQGRGQVSNSTYFNPDRFNDALLHLGWRRRLESWVFSGRVGAGQQRVGGDPLSFAGQTEMNLMHKLNPQDHINLRYTNLASAGVNGSGYRYDLLEFVWLIKLP